VTFVSIIKRHWLTPPADRIAVTVKQTAELLGPTQKQIHPASSHCKFLQAVLLSIPQKRSLCDERQGRACLVARVKTPNRSKQVSGGVFAHA
jgi:hypothetical protein